MIKPVSVVMPVRNCEKYVAEAIESILSQSFEDFEFIIVNDGSTDRTKEILLSFSDQRLVYFENAAPQGIVKCLNKAIYFSTGAFIARMDGDDVSRTDRLACQLAYFQEFPSVDILGSFVNVLSDSYPNYDNKKVIFPVPMSNGKMRVRLLERNVIFHPTVMMKKESLVEKKLCYDRYASYAEDYKLWIDAALNGLVMANIDEPLLIYRIHNGQTSYIKREDQVIMTNKLRLGYGCVFFDKIIRQKTLEYLSLINAAPNGRYKKELLSECEKLTVQLIEANDHGLFFDKEELDSFIYAKLEYIKNGSN